MLILPTSLWKIGMTKKEIDSKIDDIIEFSEVGEFIDTPVKRYSSGMFVKLAFSVAIRLRNSSPNASASLTGFAPSITKTPSLSRNFLSESDFISLISAFCFEVIIGLPLEVKPS